MRSLLIILSVMISYSVNATAFNGEEQDENLSVIILPEPDFDDAVTLMDALKMRKSTRSFADVPIKKQELSNLLWAAGGINRQGGGKTTPALCDVGIYVALPTGVYQYQDKKHELRQVISEDIRQQISDQQSVKQAPVIFIYTIEESSWRSYMVGFMDKAQGVDFYHGNQTAYPTQNVYLYACSHNMNSVVIGGFKQEFVDKKLSFKDSNNAYLIQLIGYSK